MENNVDYASMCQKDDHCYEMVALDPDGYIVMYCRKCGDCVRRKIRFFEKVE